MESFGLVDTRLQEYEEEVPWLEDKEEQCTLIDCNQMLRLSIWSYDQIREAFDLWVLEEYLIEAE